MPEQQEVRSRLRRTWAPFFGPFGRLLPVQVEAIPPVLDGQNVVVASPTASGKTEAVVAPTAERYLAEKWPPMSVLYVIPTRALANDTLRRIGGPLNDLGIAVALKHGDRPDFNPSRPPDWLITTPESLDSVLCRFPKSLGDVRSVILDELHLLDGTYRGDQLRVLLSRLRAGRTMPPFTTHVLSATLAEPLQVAARYVDDCLVVAIEGGREIQSTFVESVNEVLPLARKNRWRKALFFCNARRTVEMTAATLAPQWAPYPVVAHHGSMDRRSREEAEALLKEARVAACVCTSTLEVGIDVGDVDVVVLVEEPYSVSALLQRIGRGNRRGGVVNAVFVVETAEERQHVDAMLQAVRSGILPVREYRPDPSVAVQQIFSLLFQHREGLPEKAVADILAPLASAEVCHMLLVHLRQEGWVEQERGAWYASQRVMDMGERGKIHSNIPDSTPYEVIDSASGRSIGTIAGAFDRVFLLGRRAWEVVAVRHRTVTVQAYHGKAEPALFLPHHGEGAFWPFLPPVLRQRRSEGTGTL